MEKIKELFWKNDILRNIILSYMSIVFLTFNKSVKIVDYKSFLDVFKNDNVLLSAVGFMLFYYFISNNRIEFVSRRVRALRSMPCYQRLELKGYFSLSLLMAKCIC